MSRRRYPIKYWSYSSLITYLRNPLAWHKRYVEGVYDIPATPASIVGRAAHVALQNFYGGFSVDEATQLGLDYLRQISDFEINFGKAVNVRAKKKKRLHMESEYKQAVFFYLERPPKHKVLGVEVKTHAQIPGIAIPVKAISDLVVVSSADTKSVDIVDHKFVDSYGSLNIDNPLFMIQALFNYYTVLSEFKKPVKRFIVYECKKKKNRDRNFADTLLILKNTRKNLSYFTGCSKMQQKIFTLAEFFCPILPICLKAKIHLKFTDGDLSINKLVRLRLNTHNPSGVLIYCFKAASIIALTTSYG